MMKSKTLLRLPALLLAILMTASIMAMAFSFTASAAGSEPLKKRATYFTEEKIANARENFSKYGWAKTTAESYIKLADTYVALGYDYVWSRLPSQLLPRSYGVNQKLGCLNCGKAIDQYGNYPYKYDAISNPWKLVCPSCGLTFPTNDFKSFYESALDENGNFNVSRGDKKYLVNELYPEKGEKWGVDNGWGYVHTGGAKYTFIAYYNHEANYHYGMNNVINALLYAYIYTGNQKYADTGIVLLDRMSAIYLDMNLNNQAVSNGFLHSHGGTGLGKTIGSIWEPSVIRPYIFAYDAFFSAYKTMSKEAVDFISKISNGKRTTVNDFMVSVENGIIKEIYPSLQNGEIRGNAGMHQFTLATAAVVLDDPKLTKQWLDFDFQPGGWNGTRMTGGDMLTIFVNSVDRNGFGNEAAPGYNALWLSQFTGIADVLSGYKIGGTGESYDLYENVKFKKMMYSFLDLIIDNQFTPPIGDTGKTGYAGIVATNNNLIPAYCVYKDVKLAQAIYLLNGNTSAGLKLGVFEKDPEEFAKEIQKIVDENGELTIGSVNLTGFGYAAVKGFADYTNVETTEPEKTHKYTVAELEVLNDSLISGIVRTDSEIEFKKTDATNAVSVCFYLKNDTGTYDISLKLIGMGGSSLYNCYIDGRSLQEEVELSGKAGEELTVYFRKTRVLTKGYHTLTFDYVEGDGNFKLTNLITTLTSETEASATTNNETTTYIYYGRNTGHGHQDNLNLGLYAYGMDLLPDIGYPEFADSSDMHRLYFVENTISHNTVTINKAPQSGVVVTNPLHYDDTEFVKLIAVDGKSAYTTASEYRRTTATIKMGEGMYYLVDFFNVAGGNNQVYSLHTWSVSGFNTTGLELTKQVDDDGKYVGTLLDPSVSFGARNNASGYQYFTNVNTDNDPDENFSVDWALNPGYYSTAGNVHLKATMIGKYSKAVLSVGTPPRNKDNPSEIPYLFVENSGSSNIQSLFNAVIEPYTVNSSIKSSEKVSVKLDGTEVSDIHLRALKITFYNGRVDYIVYNVGNTTKTYKIDNLFDFKGYFAVYSITDGEKYVYTNDAEIAADVTTTARVTGKVKEFTQELSTENYITVTINEEIAAESLAGRYIYITKMSSASFNACYGIISAEKLSDGSYKLFIGDVTPIEAYKSTTNLSAGYKYSIQNGSSFYIPLSSVTGAPVSVTSGGSRQFSALSLSHSLKSEVKAGDFVGNLIAVSTMAKQASDIPKYTITLDEAFADGALFEIRDNKLYAKTDITGTSTSKYTIKAMVSTEANISETFEVDVSTMTKSASDKAIYPTFSLENLETGDSNPASDPSGDPSVDDPSDATVSGLLWLYIAIPVLLIIAVVVVIVILKSKKK